MKNFREFKENIVNKISKKVSERLEEKKREIARNMFSEAVRIDTARYKNSHGKNPSGVGTWAFSSKRRGDVDYDNKKEFFMSSASSSYENAVKQAKEWGEKNGHLYVYVMESTEDLTEVLSKSTPIEDWIKDFIDSDAPQFKGKSKEERIEMAKGAYYAKQRGE